MKQSDIKVGKTYRNKGSGNHKRKVIEISVDFRPRNWFDCRNPPGPTVPGVLWEDWSGSVLRSWLPSFASWAGSEVSDE